MMKELIPSDQHMRVTGVFYSYSFHTGVLEEATFFGITKAIEPLEGLVQVSV